MREIPPDPRAEPSRQSARGGWPYAVLSAGFLSLIGSYLVYPDLNLTYPFVGSDGYEWISNALAIGGEPVRYTARPPLLPMVLAAFELAGLSRFFPLFQLGLLGLLLGLLRRLLADVAGARSAFVIALTALGCAPLLWLGVEVMAEVLTLLLLALASRSLLAAAGDERHYQTAGLWSGLSLLAQPVAYLVLPAAVLAVACRRPRDLRHPAFWRGAGLLVAFPASWTAIRFAWLGTAGDAGNPHWGLTGWHPAHLPWFAASVISFFGWPLLVLAALGLATAAADRGHRPLAALAGGWIATCSFFFGMLYSWEDRRFAVYLALPVFLLAAVGLAALARRAAPVAVGLALLAPLSAALPVSTAHTSTLLWPLPAVAWNLRPGPGEARLATVSWGELVARTPLARVAAAGGSRPAYEPVEAREFDGDDSAVYLFSAGLRPQDPYVTQNRLGNATRLRVRLIDAGVFPDDWWRRGSLETLTPRDRYAFFRFRRPPLAPSWIVVAERGGSEARRLETLALSPPLSTPPAPLLAAAAQAERLSAPVRPRESVLAVFRPAGEDPEWLRLLPFLARTSSLFLISPAEAPGVERDLVCDDSTLAAVEGWKVRRCRWRAWKVFAVRQADSSRPRESEP